MVKEKNINYATNFSDNVLFVEHVKSNMFNMLETKIETVTDVHLSHM